MDDVWGEDTAHARFWKRLLVTRYDQLFKDRDHLRSLRYRYDNVKSLKRTFGALFDMRGECLEDLIFEACKPKIITPVEKKFLNHSAVFPPRDWDLFYQHEHNTRMLSMIVPKHNKYLCPGVVQLIMEFRGPDDPPPPVSPPHDPWCMPQPQVCVNEKVLYV